MTGSCPLPDENMSAKDEKIFFIYLYIIFFTHGAIASL